MQDGSDELGFGEEIGGRSGKRVLVRLTEAEEECVKTGSYVYSMQEVPISVCRAVYKQ